jgi:NAD(P)-dependent dehydrogenase (short-subunit alcohol dehydrogenase family)
VSSDPDHGKLQRFEVAIDSLTQALADEGKADHIKAIAICPAMVATPMTGASGPDYLQPEDIAETGYRPKAPDSIAARRGFSWPGFTFAFTK